MTIVSRDYAGEEDYARIRELLVQISAIDGAPDYGTIGDLDWWRFTDENPNAIATSRLWLDERGSAVGFSWLIGAGLPSWSILTTVGLKKTSSSGQKSNALYPARTKRSP